MADFFKGVSDSYARWSRGDHVTDDELRDLLVSIIEAYSYTVVFDTGRAIEAFYLQIYRSMVAAYRGRGLPDEPKINIIVRNA